METNELNKIYDGWKESMRNKRVLEEGSQNILSDNPYARGNARRNLETILNVRFPDSITPNTPTDSLLRHVAPEIGVYTEEAFARIIKNPHGFIQKAYDNKRDKFAKNYLKIAPYFIKIEDNKMKFEVIKTNGINTNIIEEHASYHSLNETLNSYNPQNRDVRSAREFADKISPLMEREFIAEMTSNGVSRETAEKRASLAMEVYATEPQIMYAFAVRLRESARERLESRFANNDEKAKYAKALLDAKVDYATGHPGTNGEKNDINYRMLSDDLYNTIA